MKKSKMNAWNELKVVTLNKVRREIFCYFVETFSRRSLPCLNDKWKILLRFKVLHVV